MPDRSSNRMAATVAVVIVAVAAMIATAVFVDSPSSVFILALIAIALAGWTIWLSRGRDRSSPRS